MFIAENSSNYTDPWPCLIQPNQSLTTAETISNNDMSRLTFSFICLVIGIFGNITSIAAMFRQLRTEKIYYLQLPIMLSDLVACLFRVPQIIYQPFVIRASPGPNWAKRNFLFSWYGVTVGTPLGNTFITTSLVLVAAVSMDRLQVQKSRI